MLRHWNSDAAKSWHLLRFPENSYLWISCRATQWERYKNICYVEIASRAGSRDRTSRNHDRDCVAGGCAVAKPVQSHPGAFKKNKDTRARTKISAARQSGTG